MLEYYKLLIGSRIVQKDQLGVDLAVTALDGYVQSQLATMHQDKATMKYTMPREIIRVFRHSIHLAMKYDDLNAVRKLVGVFKTHNIDINYPEVMYSFIGHAGLTNLLFMSHASIVEVIDNILPHNIYYGHPDLICGNYLRILEQAQKQPLSPQARIPNLERRITDLFIHIMENSASSVTDEALVELAKKCVVKGNIPCFKHLIVEHLSSFGRTMPLASHESSLIEHIGVLPKAREYLEILSRYSKFDNYVCRTNLFEIMSDYSVLENHESPEYWLDLLHGVSYILNNTVSVTVWDPEKDAATIAAIAMTSGLESKELESVLDFQVFGEINNFVDAAVRTTLEKLRDELCSHFIAMGQAKLMSKLMNIGATPILHFPLNHYSADIQALLSTNNTNNPITENDPNKNNKPDMSVEELKKQNEKETNCIRCYKPLEELDLAFTKIKYCPSCEQELTQ